MLEVYSYQLDIARESEERVRALRHDIKHHIKRLKEIKKAEFFVARTLDPQSEILKTDKAFTEFLDETFDELIKFYS